MAERKKDQANDGRGNFGNPQQHADAGRMGGEATAKTHDKSFYEGIGSEGGKASTGSFEKGDERAREAGRKGGKGNNSGVNIQNNR